MKYNKPLIEYPTLILFILSLIGSLSVGTFYITINNFQNKLFENIILLACILLSSFFSYAQFTVAHDAVHKSISKNIIVNDLIGYISSFWLGPTSFFKGLRFIHLQHHKYTNNPNKDPDFWCSDNAFGGSKLILLRWLTIDINYLTHYIYNLKFKSFMEIIELLIYYTFIISLIHYSINNNFFDILLKFWIIPSRIALIILVFAFDYLPHNPHINYDNIYKKTSYLSINKFFNPLLTLIIFYQNYHIIHHLFPNIPFYKYKNIWNLKKKELYEKGVKKIKLLKWK